MSLKFSFLNNFWNNLFISVIFQFCWHKILHTHTHTQNQNHNTNTQFFSSCVKKKKKKKKKHFINWIFLVLNWVDSHSVRLLFQFPHSGSGLPKQPLNTSTETWLLLSCLLLVWTQRCAKLPVLSARIRKVPNAFHCE